jgi:hypothetical protein
VIFIPDTDPDLDFLPSQIPDPGVKKARHRIPDPQDWFLFFWNKFYMEAFDLLITHKLKMNRKK